LGCSSQSLLRKNTTRAGDFVVEHPTLLSLGFEWAIQGDANRNASVDVRYRAIGQSDWRPALPLVRIGDERVYRVREHLDYTVPDGFAGSILNLQPGTEYECEFKLTDPDGDNRADAAYRQSQNPNRTRRVQWRAHAARISTRISGPEARA
jgi:hypothetical protein